MTIGLIAINEYSDVSDTEVEGDFNQGEVFKARFNTVMAELSQKRVLKSRFDNVMTELSLTIPKKQVFQESSEGWQVMTSGKPSKITEETDKLDNISPQHEEYKEAATTSEFDHSKLTEETLEKEKEKEVEPQIKQTTKNKPSADGPASKRNKRKTNKLQKEDKSQKKLNDITLRGRPQHSRSSTLASLGTQARSPTPKSGLTPDRQGAQDKKRRGSNPAAPILATKSHISKEMVSSPAPGQVSNNDLVTQL